LKFDRVGAKRSSRPDVHAFILLTELCPGSGCIVDAAEHDKIWLSIDVGDLESNATEANIVELIRCGVMYDDEMESLAMYV